MLPGDVNIDKINNAQLTCGVSNNDYLSGVATAKSLVNSDCKFFFSANEVYPLYPHACSETDIIIINIFYNPCGNYKKDYIFI